MSISAKGKSKLKSLSKQYNRKLQTIIQPSTKLICVNVHKLKDLQTCNRKYFWKWVMNLEPTKMSLPFWFGSMVHTAMEYYVQGVKYKELCKLIDKHSKLFIGRYALAPEMAEELALQLRIIKTIIKVYIQLFSKKLDKHETLATEESFKVSLNKTPVKLLGTIDWRGIYKDLAAIKEYKTASRVNAEYFQRLKFDKQLNLYAIGHRALTGKLPGICPYTVFRKPGISCRMNETPDQFIARLEEDLHVRADWYYLQEDIRFSKHQVEAILDDVEWLVFDLFCKYETLSEEQVISPCNWPRNDEACFQYGVCEYFCLCQNVSAFQTFLPLFQMREIRYEEEKQELSKPLKLEKRSKRIPSRVVKK